MSANGGLPEQNEYCEAEEKEHGPRGRDDVNGRDVSTPPHMLPGGTGISGWQSPLSIRETLIVLVAVAGLMFEGSQTNSQMAQRAPVVTSLSATITALHQDVATTSAEMRSHIEAPGHSVSMERIAVLNNRLDDLTARVKLLEGSAGH